jgi:hypothetical protein
MAHQYLDRCIEIGVCLFADYIATLLFTESPLINVFMRHNKKEVVG